VGFQFEHMLGFALMLAGRYEEAIDHVDRALRDRPDYHPAMRARLALCGYLGREKEGRDFVQRLLRANPAMTIAGFQAFVAAHQVPETSAVFVEGFRRAGLPEK
jgi:tetratricopeptide (TPR) repeat protein